MTNLNTKQTEKIIPFLLERDGRICKKCKTSLENISWKIEVDHIDGNSDNNPPDYSNYQLLCKRCNVVKGNKQRANINLVEDRPYTPEMKASLIGEPKFKNWCINYVVENHSLCKNNAIYGGASVIGRSPETTKRYMKKMIADEIFDFGMGSCTSQLCDGIHLYFKGNAPKYEESLI